MTMVAVVVMAVIVAAVSSVVLVVAAVVVVVEVFVDGVPCVPRLLRRCRRMTVLLISRVSGTLLLLVITRMLVVWDRPLLWGRRHVVGP
jgi:hypothetical protein